MSQCAIGARTRRVTPKFILLGGPRDEYAVDPLATARTTLKGDQVRSITDIVGAELLELRSGIVTVTMDKAARLYVPYVRLADGARMRVNRPKIDKDRRFVHIAQHSGGQLIGGVSLELRPRK